MFNPEKYGPWALVCGASDGMGEAFADRLGNEGLNQVLIARSEDKLEKVAERVREEHGVEVRTLAMDLTSPEMLYRTAKITEDLEVGLLVYVAGANQTMVPFFELPIDKALRVVRLNPIGQVSLCHHFGNKMKVRGRGGMILIGSLAALAGGYPLAAYCAAKAFEMKLVEGMWSELKGSGVDVLYELVGAVLTPNHLAQKAAVAGTDRQRAKSDTAKIPPDFPYPPETLVQYCLEYLPEPGIPVHCPEFLMPFFEEALTTDRAEASNAMVRWTKI